MTALVSKPDHGSRLVNEQGLASIDLQRYLDDIAERLNANLLGDQVTLPSYKVTALPPVIAAPGLIFVSDATGGPVPAYSDGADWRKVTSGVIVS